MPKKGSKMHKQLALARAETAQEKRKTDKEEEDSKKEDTGNAEDNGKRKEEKGPRQRRPRGIHTNKVTEIEQLKVSGGSQQPLGAKRSRIKPTAFLHEQEGRASRAGKRAKGAAAGIADKSIEEDASETQKKCSTSGRSLVLMSLLLAPSLTVFACSLARGFCLLSTNARCNCNKEHPALFCASAIGDD